MAERYIPIDEEGYFVFNGLRVDDDTLGRELLENLRYEEKDRYVTSMGGDPQVKAWVEAFDAPLIAKHVRLSNTPGEGVLDLPYRGEARFDFNTLSVDEWDRFHGVSDKQIPFVLSRTAQYEFFDLLDAFDDDSVTVKGHRYPTPSWLEPQSEINHNKFWTHIYQSEEPGWELGRESVILPSVLPQLKLNKARVLVLGCGSGHDAAYFASQGHMVTAVDFSEEAIRRAHTNYGGVENLRIMQADAFQLPAEFNAQFDLVFEHTCYCAISPERRNELVGVWRKVLVPGGDLLGIFFTSEMRAGPPFGGSEWELRQRLRNHFNFLFWTRWRHSLDKRKGKELVVFAKRKELV